MKESKNFINFLRPRVPPSTLGRAQGRKISKILAFFFVAIFFLVGFFLIKLETLIPPPPYQGGGAESGGSQIKSVEIGGQSVQVDLALTEAEQAQGLSGRQSLLEDEGMLFVFDKPGNYLFWMKDMNFPIDIIWLAPSEGGDVSKVKVDYIKKNADPKLFPETYGPGDNDLNAKYVLEVTAGFADKNNLKDGDSVEFVY